MNEFDVVVSGGGIVGLSTAHSFATRGWQTLLIDSDKTPDSMGHLGSDLRTVALSPAAYQLLEDLGLPEEFPKGTIERMSVWEDDGTAAIDMSCHDVNEPYLAVVLEVTPMVEALRNNNPSNLTVRSGSTITCIETRSRTVVVDKTDAIRTQLLVIAEGSRSSSVELMNAKFAIDQNLNQHTLATTVDFAQPHNNCAWQKFAPTPVALLPHKKPNRMSVLWSLPENDASALAQLDEPTFLQKLTTTLERICGEALVTDRRIVFPLAHRLLADFNPEPWVLVIGDAAHTIHPLAGQGVNLGLEDVRVLAHELNRSNQRLGSPARWREYAAKRKLRANSLIKLMMFFSQTYSASHPFARLIRNAGVRLVNSSASFKKQLIREAMGTGPLANVT